MHVDCIRILQRTQPCNSLRRRHAWTAFFIVDMHLLTFFLLGTICRHALAFNYPVCCREANSAERLFDWDNGTNTYAPLKQPYSTCGQVYSANIPPARPIYITYESCRANCRGFDLTKIKELSIWAAPLIQFIM